ncbi:unnamed protein product [Cuscuta epithymum]|uniref:Uncharacterized protein n=1 Tax=Cuscuta epithymum TaxID=186058 RepID=A0AAV0E1Y1_9ASTE|nr:unnamed protein product [Cuscuta epithymum]
MAPATGSFLLEISVRCIYKSLTSDITNSTPDGIIIPKRKNIVAGSPSKCSEQRSPSAEHTIDQTSPPRRKSQAQSMEPATKQERRPNHCTRTDIAATETFSFSSHSKRNLELAPAAGRTSDFRWWHVFCSSLFLQNTKSMTNKTINIKEAYLLPFLALRNCSMILPLFIIEYESGSPTERKNSTGSVLVFKSKLYRGIGPPCARCADP